MMKSCKEDSFIVQMDPDVFDSVTDNALKVKQEERQWHVLSLSVEEDEKDHQSTIDLQTRPEHDDPQDVPASSSAAIDLWSAQEQDIRKLQHESKDLQPILNWLEDGILPYISEAA